MPYLFALGGDSEVINANEMRRSQFDPHRAQAAFINLESNTFCILLYRPVTWHNFQ
jgi:hypothetical protein